MLQELHANGVAAFGARLNFGDGFLQETRIRYDYDLAALRDCER
jgi:hypothetical protein